MTEGKVYFKPELVELGKAATLTLGASGCGADAYCCKYADVELQ